MFCNNAQRHFAQRRQIALAKEILRGPGSAFSQVNFSFTQPRAQLFGSQIDQDYFIRQINNRVGNGFANGNTGDLPDGIAAAGDMLDIESGVNIDAGIEKFENVLVTFRMARSRRVRMGKLIDHGKPGMPCQDGVEIHFRQARSAILDLGPRHDRHAFEQRLRFLATVRFNNPNDDLAFFRLLLPRRLEHGVGLADPRGHSEEDLQLATGRRGFLALQMRENRIWVRPFGLAHAATLLGASSLFKSGRSRR